MGYFDAEKFGITLTVHQSNKSDIHVAGGSVSGVVLITCAEPAQARAVTLMHAMRGGPSVGTGSASTDTAVAQGLDRRTPFFAQEIVLFGHRTGPAITIAPGEYRYPFQIPLPKWLPPTIADKNGNGQPLGRNADGHVWLGAMRHTLDVRVIIANAVSDKKHRVPLNVQQAAAYESIYSSPVPGQARLTGGTEPECGGCCDTYGTVDVTIKVPRTTYSLAGDRAVHGTVRGGARNTKENTVLGFQVALVRRSYFPEGRGGAGLEILEPVAFIAHRKHLDKEEPFHLPIDSSWPPCCAKIGKIPIVIEYFVTVLATRDAVPFVETSKCRIPLHVAHSVAQPKNASHHHRSGLTAVATEDDGEVGAAGAPLQQDESEQEMTSMTAQQLMDSAIAGGGGQNQDDSDDDFYQAPNASTKHMHFQFKYAPPPDLDCRPAAAVDEQNLQAANWRAPVQVMDVSDLPEFRREDNIDQQQQEHGYVPPTATLREMI